jgi:hypothetical protein
MQYATSAPEGASNGAIPDLARAPSPQSAGIIELQASVGFLHDQAAAAVRRLYDYLEQHSPTHPELDGCLTPATDASRAFEAADYGRALAEIHQAYRAVAAARAANPSLPPLSGLARAAGAA